MNAHQRRVEKRSIARLEGLRHRFRTEHVVESVFERTLLLGAARMFHDTEADKVLAEIEKRELTPRQRKLHIRDFQRRLRLPPIALRTTS